MNKFEIPFDSKESLNQFKKHYFSESIGDVFLVGQSEIDLKLYVLCERIEDLDEFYVRSRKQESEDFIKVEYIEPFLKKQNQTTKLLRLVLNVFQSVIKEHDYWNLSRGNQNLVIANLLEDVAELHQDGLSHGYLSYLSNLKFFLSQLERITDEETYQKLKAQICSANHLEKDYIESPVQQEGNAELSKLMQYLKLNYESLNFDDFPKPETFFLNAETDMNYSEFHKAVFSNPILVNRYNRSSFYTYRMLMTLIFKYLPLLGISLTARNHIIYLLVRNVERYYGITWESQILESLEIEKHVNQKSQR